MSDAVELSIIVPAYNESGNLPPLLTELSQKRSAWRAEIVVVDDGSRDRTSDVARAHGAVVVRLEQNQGKGAAVRAGFAAASGRYLVQIDADRQFVTEEIERLVDALRRGADIVFGSRFIPGARLEPGSMVRTNRVAHAVICAAGWLASGIRVRDVMAGFKAFRRESALALDLCVPHFGYEAEILVRAGQLGLRVVEVPVTFRRRREGASNVRKLRDGCRVLTAIVRTAWSRRETAEHRAMTRAGHRIAKAESLGACEES